MSDTEEFSAAMDERLKTDGDDDEVEVWVVNDEGEKIDDALSQETDSQPLADEATLRDELKEARNQWLRTLADFDNFRKRAEREKADLKRYALTEPLRDLLPVIDNLERAVNAEGSVEDLKLGVEMTLTQLREMLQRRGLQLVPAAGHPFDPAVHDAVSRFEDEAVPHPTVAEEFQSGYMLHDRLLRPAMVRVAMPPDQKSADAGGKEKK